MEDVVPDLDRGRESKGGGRFGLGSLGLSGVGIAVELCDDGGCENLFTWSPCFSFCLVSRAI